MPQTFIAQVGYASSGEAVKESRGALGRDDLPALLVALQMVYLLRAGEPLPLVGASPEDAAALASARELDTRFLLGDLYLGLWLHPQTREELGQGLDRARTPADRWRFLAALAELARREHRDDDARRLSETDALGAAPA